MIDEKELLRIKNKYYREIKLTKVRIIEKTVKLTDEEVNQLEYRLDPRNRAEDEIKENYMGFIGQRLLEGYNQDKALEMARICVDEAIILAKEEVLKKRKSKFKI